MASKAKQTVVIDDESVFDFVEEMNISTFGEPEEVVEPTSKRGDKKEVRNIVINAVDPAVSKRQDDIEKIQREMAEFRNKLAGERKIAFKPPKYYAEILGSVYVFSFKCVNVPVRFDGTTQYFPETIHTVLMRKLSDILDASTPKTMYDDI